MTKTLPDTTVRRAEEVLAPTYSRPPVLFEKGEGCWLEDDHGRRYLDMGSGIAVNALGHGNETVTRALAEASCRPLHLSNLYHTRAPVELANSLVEKSFADRVFFANSGTEAVEAAIKFARAAHPDRDRIIFFDGSFHGRTLGALAATDRPDYQAPFRPLPEGFTRAAFNDIDALAVIDETSAAVIVEPIQGERGVRLADRTWLREVHRKCRSTGALLIFDEIQCGLGRTGRLWAHEEAGITPDLMTLAKPLGGGLPIGAVLMTEAVASHLRPGMHGTTFGGGPAVTHVARAVFQRLSDPELLQRVRELGTHLDGALRAIKSDLVHEVRGIGLMLGVKVGAPVKEVVAAALEEHLLVLPSADQVIRFLPALTVTREELDEAAKRFSTALDRIYSQRAEDNHDA